MAFIISVILFKVSEQLRFLGIKLINPEDFTELMLRLLLNMFVCFVIVHIVYKSKKTRCEFSFTYYTLSALVFLLCYLLGNVKLELGFALGLFAIFGIIRYRTSLIPIKEMTYLFVIIGIAVINALANKKVSYAELFFANIILIVIMAFLERRMSQTGEKHIRYDNVALIHQDRKNELIGDLKVRTGLNIVNVIVGDVDYMKDTAELTVYYKK